MRGSFCQKKKGKRKKKEKKEKKGKKKESPANSPSRRSFPYASRRSERSTDGTWPTTYLKQARETSKRVIKELCCSCNGVEGTKTGSNESECPSEKGEVKWSEVSVWVSEWSVSNKSKARHIEQEEVCKKAAIERGKGRTKSSKQAAYNQSIKHLSNQYLLAYHTNPTITITTATLTTRDL